MLNVEITSLGTAIPKQSVKIAGATRYRISGNESHLGLLVESAQKALKKANLTINDMDAIIGAVGVGLQPIPSTAALIHEALAPEKNIPAFDINSTCTSFVTALDIVGNYIEMGRCRRVLIVSGDVPSIALNPNEKHSFELFGDGAVSAVVQKSERSSILFATQLTNSRGAHLTEIVGGLTAMPAYVYSPEIAASYQFHMEGRKILKLAASFAEEGVQRLEKESGMSLADIDMVIPHQASKALGLIMKKIGVADNQYIDIVQDYGNMVSASIPFALDYAIENGKVKRGDKILLIGTAAGLTLNAMILKY
ncbi:MAG: 3-oxoacyl-ACP synthase [Streptococcaceae bacterium]|jgi:3-oxoacyl-[acyl-carrier-protein] synthase-3|nr:3-oxoacyl-ACP synthase [Streptococcaceae bacterium]